MSETSTIVAPAPSQDGAAVVGPARRIDAVDVARGVALAAMATYHLTWDLGFLAVTRENVALTGPGRDAARLIAGAFLMLVGVSLVLAHGAGLRPRAFLRRLGLVAGAALAITAATRVLFPASYIYFGVLHHVAAASLLALPFLRAPLAIVLAASVAAFGAPLLLTGPAFDAPALAFLGLGQTVPTTNDYVPLLPWFGAVLAGVAAARAAGRRAGPGGAARWRAGAPLARGLALAGRHSLAIYLVHQPLLLGLVWILAAVVGPHPRAGEAGFRRAFGAECARAGGTEAACAVAGRCLVGRLREADLWAGPGGARDAPADRARATGLARACFDAARGAAPPP